MISEEDDP